MNYSKMHYEELKRNIKEANLPSVVLDDGKGTCFKRRIDALDWINDSDRTEFDVNIRNFGVHTFITIR